MMKVIDKLALALSQRLLVVFSCSCEVTYHGRAESFLPKGNRLVIIKPDGTLLVHQPSGSNPVNHMRTGASHSVFSDGDGFVVKSVHEKFKEHLLVRVFSVDLVQTSSLVDDESIMTYGTEKDMAEMLYQHPHLVEHGFKPLSREEHTAFGFIDVFGYDPAHNLVVVECKRQKADLQAVTQLRRYVEKIKASKGLSYVRGILASPQISDNAKRMLEEWGYKWVMVEPPRQLTTRDKHQRGLHHYQG